MRETEERPDLTSALRREVGDLRACMRDLVAFGAMPATWTGREPPAIVESLVDALLSMLHAELVFARLDCPPHWKGVNVVCAAAGALPAERARGVAEALEPLLTGASVGDCR